MKNIFIGFVLIFLDFNLNIGNSQIGLIPDFIGYIIMINGLIEIGTESPLFTKVKPFATGMAVYTGILYLMNLVGISASLGMLSYILPITTTIVSLYIAYNIVMGVIDMEGKYNTLLNGDTLKSTWTFLAVFDVLSFAALLFPLAALLCVFVSIIAAICFLVAFNNSKNLYYNSVGKPF